ncbi:MAG: hypothetical protein KAT34_13825, partial [Candidatus Aminicenantes bacterium]|nr:hypothetical protein [Candidatus Aminicenantes bacterium]
MMKLRETKQILLTLLLLFGVFLLPLTAGKGRILFVETEVDLKQNGEAVVGYTVRWEVLSGELHGFYFQGNDRLKAAMVPDNSYAVDSSEREYKLDISYVGSGKWDIILANGQGVSRGTVTYVFYFTANFAAAGYLAPTTTDTGQKLAVFNWAPVQWDEASQQKHYTLKILTPHILSEYVTPRQYVEENQLILTEKWVNKEYLIDYRRSRSGRLMLVFHKNDPGNRFHMRTQFYMPAHWFGLPEATPLPGSYRSEPVKATGKGPGISDDKKLWYGGMGVLLIIFFLIMFSKHRSVVTAQKGLKEIHWKNLNWTPPKLVLSSFRKTGKICKSLTPIEAAFYLGLPLKRVLSSLLDAMAAEGYMEVVRESP